MNDLSNNLNTQKAEIHLKAPQNGEILEINKIICRADEGVTLKFGIGTFYFNETLELNKSLRLVGEGPKKTIITSENIEYLIKIKNNNNIVIEGISFVINDDDKKTAINIYDGKIEIKKCIFSIVEDFKDQNLAIGIYAGGKAYVEITDCLFEDYQNIGLSLNSNVNGVVKNNQFIGNEVGLIASGNTSVNTIENHFTKNHVSLAYEENANGQIKENSFIKNRGAILIKGNADVSILHNSCKKVDGAIGLFEKCNAIVEGNEIKDGEKSIVARNYTKAKIIDNLIDGNVEGIQSTEQSNTEILNNSILNIDKFGILIQDESITYIAENIIKNNGAGIKFDNESKFKAEKNQITDNVYGILATANSEGEITENIIKDNNKDPMGWNVKVRENAKVEFDDYKELQKPGEPVNYSKTENMYTVSIPPNANKISFEKVLRQIKAGDIIFLEKGEYVISEPIQLNKPISIIGESQDEVIIIGEEFNNLIVYEGEGNIEIKGIKLLLNSSGQTNVVVIKSGHLYMDDCVVDGGRDNYINKRDFGAGLLISGNANAKVSNSSFLENLIGLCVQNDGKITLNSNCFDKNYGYGVVFRDRSEGKLGCNRYDDNKGYGLMAYEESKVIIKNDKCGFNQAGMGFTDNAEGIIEKTESSNNEYHGFFMDNEAKCSIINCKIISNGLSGIGLFGNTQTEIVSNEISENSEGGIESGENAQSKIKNNKINNNGSGIFLTDNTSSTIFENDIQSNRYGIKIEAEARAEINKNRIYKNSEGGLVDWSNNESILGENEFFENGKPSTEDSIENIEQGMSFGDFLAQIFESENLSDDPNIAAIPITDEMIGYENASDDQPTKEENESEDEGEIE